MSENPIRIYINKNPEMPGPSQGYDVIDLPASLLRDLFAGMAASSLADESFLIHHAHGKTYYEWIEPATIAQRSYDIADALLAERARREGK